MDTFNKNNKLEIKNRTNKKEKKSNKVTLDINDIEEEVVKKVDNKNLEKNTADETDSSEVAIKMMDHKSNIN